MTTGNDLYFWHSFSHVDQYDIFNASWRNRLHSPGTGEMRDCSRATVQGVDRKVWILGWRSKAGMPGMARWLSGKGTCHQLTSLSWASGPYVKGENQLLQIFLWPPHEWYGSLPSNIFSSVYLLYSQGCPSLLSSQSFPFPHFSLPFFFPPRKGKSLWYQHFSAHQVKATLPGWSDPTAGNRVDSGPVTEGKEEHWEPKANTVTRWCCRVVYN